MPPKNNRITHIASIDIEAVFKIKILLIIENMLYLKPLSLSNEKVIEYSIIHSM